MCHKIGIWIYLWIDDNNLVEFFGKIFIAGVSFVAALSFLLYGGRLFYMLKHFPMESKGRRKKLHEFTSIIHFGLEKECALGRTWLKQ
ncbi:unnamed protein product [Trifolium pratense]|uniref:Uncharacterized protein n=2 Tax=Trifolium pratense TaxID=57577 RepID=A0ACB0M945_TRIPR|nr:unnamed protein product [Trifolium pratense]CAJ2677018.1 unnamed protein product [Trifolium pratense]